MDTTHERMVEQIWRAFLTEGVSGSEQSQRRLFKLLPGFPRCKICWAPFHGAGSLVARNFYGKRPSSLNPHMCNFCEQFAAEYSGGAEVELSLLFADVRGSTALAERMTPTEFSRLVGRFFSTATEVMVRNDALIDKIIGDQAAGIFAPGLVGPGHARRAIKAAQEILRATGHGHPDGPWIPLGVGVHTGVAFVGSVGSASGAIDITVLGDTANTAARLSSSAGVGEILISDAAFQAAGLDPGEMAVRQVDLKGKSLPMLVHALTNKEKQL